MSKTLDSGVKLPLVVPPAPEPLRVEELVGMEPKPKIMHVSTLKNPVVGRELAHTNFCGAAPTVHDVRYHSAKILGAGLEWGGVTYCQVCLELLEDVG